ncbi:MAG TPA: DsrE family protein [Burkholderiaceae bacterium]|nr:DsrE family protein [Burkholderiaceae bacterium]
MSISLSRRLPALAMLWLLALVPLQGLAQKLDLEILRAVIQVSDNDPQKWNLALNNARNVQNDLGAEATELEIVVYGPGIGMLKADSPVAKRVADALGKGVKVVACENTMKGQKLTYADMLPNIGYVNSGVVELMERQRKHWAYIRP